MEQSQDHGLSADPAISLGRPTNTGLMPKIDNRHPGHQLPCSAEDPGFKKLLGGCSLATKSLEIEREREAVENAVPTCTSPQQIRLKSRPLKMSSQRQCAESCSEELFLETARTGS